LSSKKQRNQGRGRGDKLGRKSGLTVAANSPKSNKKKAGGRQNRKLAWRSWAQPVLWVRVQGGQMVGLAYIQRPKGPQGG